MANRTRKKTAPPLQQQIFNNVHKTCFLDWSAELRNEVYSLLFRQSKEIRLYSWGSSDSPRDDYASLSRVNRQVHTEVTSFFFGYCTFDFFRFARRSHRADQRDDARSFLKMVGSSIVHLRNIKLPYMTESTINGVLHGLKGLLNLATLEISDRVWRSIRPTDMALLKSRKTADISSLIKVVRFQPSDRSQHSDAAAEAFFDDFEAL
ncbi:hypothetical protein Slin14017_G085120 [Septoria linicola]|nr:hypothetical protein Slin14017_G085120 [Septoria linicola]